MAAWLFLIGHCGLPNWLLLARRCREYNRYPLIFVADAKLVKSGSLVINRQSPDKSLSIGSTAV